GARYMRPAPAVRNILPGVRYPMAGSCMKR
ncbi:MAG: hypothetical protein QOF51_2230, partial [Chloroflexota bacterium]|nr:hypothetical protein [Chloroflexota bacterium]